MSGLPDPVLDLRVTFPERKPYTGPASQPVTKEFSFPVAGRFRITATYGPWYRVGSEQFKWRSIVPIDGRDYGAWVEFIPGVTTDGSKTRAVPDPRVDGAGLVIVCEVAVRHAQPRMEAAIFPAVVRFGDGSLHQLPSSASVVIESLVGDGSGANTPRAFDPGRVWTVEEPDFQGGTWYGTWTRRGDGNTYDAYWRHTSGREHRGTVEFRGIDGQRIAVFRPDVNGTYSAQIGADGRTVIGGTASWYPPGWTWHGSRTKP